MRWLVCLLTAWIKSEGDYAPVAQSLCQLEAEEQVGALGLRIPEERVVGLSIAKIVIIKPDGRGHRPGRRDIDDAAPVLGLKQGGHEEIRE